MSETDREAVEEACRLLDREAKDLGYHSHAYTPVLRALLAAKEAAEAKIDACKVYLKDNQDPADRLAQNHREIRSLLEMLAKDRKRAEAAEAKLGMAVDAMREVDERANRTYRARNGKMCSIEADDGEACEIVHSDALFQLRATLAHTKPKEADNGG